MRGNRYFIFVLILLSLNSAEKKGTTKGQSHLLLNAQKVQVVSVQWFANERIFLLPTHFFRPP